MKKAAKKIRADIATDYGSFSIVLEREPDMGGFMVTAPKIAGVVTWGKNQAQAKRMAKEAIECAIEGDILLAAEKEGFASLRKQHVHA